MNSLACEAAYTPSIVPDYAGNPWIEALPPIMSRQDFGLLATLLPKYHPAELEASSDVRVHYLGRLKSLRVPTTEAFRCVDHIDVEIRRNYIPRDPRTTSARRAMYSSGLPYISCTNETPCCMSLIGLSGVGKSTAIDASLSAYPQVIIHHNVTPGIATQPQIVWLKVDCPHDASLRGLCFAILREIDELIGTTYVADFTRSRLPIEGLLTSIYTIVGRYQVGVLVLDELQHLGSAKVGGSSKMLNFFVNLVNGVRVPLIFCGTYAFARIISAQLRNGRRGTGAGSIVVPRLRPDEDRWDQFVETMWKYQWVRKPVPLDDNLKRVLFDLTQGIRDFMISLFRSTQERAIRQEIETLTPELFHEVYQEEFFMVDRVLELLRNGRREDDAIFDELLDGSMVSAVSESRERAKVRAFSPDEAGRSSKPKKWKTTQKKAQVSDRPAVFQPGPGTALGAVEGGPLLEGAAGYDALVSKGLVDAGMTGIVGRGGKMG